ncbi:cytidine deaminase [Gynuella sp.]|uniref:cytidine deaminase n=1 Tax=Gynuella sp. TaxID=2969146 RepID=UPI003D140144
MNAALMKLREAAKEAAVHAYVPYSSFPVGAAIELTENGQYLQGCNVENSAYSMAICAERNALVQSIAKGVPPGTLKTMGIYMPGETLYSPCGACRQMIHELMAEDAVIYAFCDSAEFKQWTKFELLPDGFAM